MGIRSSKYAQKKKKKQAIYIVAAILGIVLIVVGLCRLTYLSAIEIRDISISGNNRTAPEEIIQIVRSKTQGGYFHLLSKNNIFLYPKGEIEDMLLEKIPRLSSVLMSWESWHGVHIDIEERKPAGLFCKGKRQDTTENRMCFFADEHAFVFDAAPEFTPDVYTRYFFASGRMLPELGQLAMDTKTFQEISNFVNEAEKMKLSVDSVSIGVAGEYELTISHQADGSEGVLYIDSRQPLTKTLENLESFLGDTTIKGAVQKYRPIEYLDLRYGNNLYFKFK